MHRTPAGDFHGGCLDEDARELEAGEARRRRSAVDRRDAMTRAAGRR